MCGIEGLAREAPHVLSSMCTEGLAREAPHVLLKSTVLACLGGTGMLRRQGLKLHPAIGALPRTFVKETYSIQHMFQCLKIQLQRRNRSVGNTFT